MLSIDLPANRTLAVKLQFYSELNDLRWEEKKLK